jgi:quercetin dioxygenase-like cupin family protein
MAKLKVETAHADARGEIVDLLEGETINAVTLVTFRAGAIRGNHYHKQTTQWNYLIAGSLRFLSQVPDGPIIETMIYPGDLVVSAPHERHAFVALEDSQLMVFTQGPRAGEAYETDTFRLEVPLATASR